jgi:hypothetical protein
MITTLIAVDLSLSRFVWFSVFPSTTPFTPYRWRKGCSTCVVTCVVTSSLAQDGPYIFLSDHLEEKAVRYSSFQYLL